MRRSIVTFAFASVCAFLASSLSNQAQAQIGGTGVGADPFSFYFGYYLPHAQYMASQTTPLDSVNRAVANRQALAATNRSDLFDPVSPFDEGDLDQFRPFSSSRTDPRRRARNRGFVMTDPVHSRGTGPAGYFNRTAQYYPTLRVARGQNQNVVTLRSRRGAGGGMPMMPQAPSAGGVPMR